MTKQEKVIQNLQFTIDWFKRHPNAPVPYSLYSGRHYCRLSSDKAERDAEVRAIGSAVKEFTDNEVRLIVDISRGEDENGMANGLELEFYVPRKEVCRAIVVGQRFVPAEVIPERIVESHIEDVIEWDCVSLLTDAEPKDTDQ